MIVMFKTLTPLLRIIFGVRYGLRLSNAIQFHTHPHLFAVKPCAPEHKTDYAEKIQIAAS